MTIQSFKCTTGASCQASCLAGRYVLIPTHRRPMDGPSLASWNIVDNGAATATPVKGILVRILTDFIFLIVFFFLLSIWAVAWLAFHVASGGIHILLGLAVVFLVIHFMRGRSAA